MNQDFKSPLVESSLGGKGGGGAKLTENGIKVLNLFRDMEKKAQKSLLNEKKLFSSFINFHENL